jgi:hypothetical protein
MNRIEDSYKDKVEWYRDNKRIEISSKEYWKMMDYHSGLMYCSLLVIDGKDDWRMLKDWEELERVTQKYENMLKMILWFVDNDGLWLEDDRELYTEMELMGYNYYVIPVREY